MISFVNPLFLAGLAFAAAPALVHLLRRDVGRRVTFPPAALLVSSAEVVLRSWRLAEILLLALRVLVIVGFVLALARPRIVISSLGTDERILASVAIVVDDTPSMGAAFRGPSRRIDEARRAVKEIVGRLESGSRVRIQTASRLLLDAGVDLEEAGRLGESLKPSDVAASVPNALAESVSWLKNEPSPRELYVISDFQRSSWPVEDAAGAGYRVPVHVIDVGGEPLDDWAVSRVRVTEPRVLRGLLFELNVEVRASSAGTRELVLEVEGNELRRERLRLAAGERTEVAFELAASEAGPLVGVARLVGADDAWPENDSRAFAVQVQGAPLTLCVGAGPGDGALAGELVSRALAPFAGGERELARVEEASPPLPAGQDLARYDCVVIAAPSDINAADWGALHAFVEDGGGLLVFPDEGMARKGLGPAAEGLLPATSAGVRAPPSPVRLARLDYEHPALRGFEGGANGRLEKVTFRRFLALDGLKETGGEVLAWFVEGKRTPALVEGRRGRGRILLFASGPTAWWGELFREPVFVPFVHEAVAFLARSGPAQLSGLAGDRVRVGLHPSERGSRARLEDRSLRPAVRREVAVDAERLEVPLGRLTRRGVFHVVTGGRGGRGGTERAVVVELDPREFSHERANTKKLFGRRALLARSSGELASVFARTRGGAEVTGYVAWATLAVFLAEMLVSAHLTRRRSASQGQAANARGAI